MCGGHGAFSGRALVFGAYDPKGGAVEHGPRLPYRAEALHRPEIIGGVRECEAGELLKSFFRTLRGEEPLPPA
jgi:tRNA(Arg) A34 adenosine deaminase TadA